MSFVKVRTFFKTTRQTDVLIKPKLLEAENEALINSEVLKSEAHIILSVKQQSGSGSIEINVHNNQASDI